MGLEGTRKVMGFGVMTWLPTGLKHVIFRVYFLLTVNFIRNTMFFTKLMKTFCSQEFPPCFNNFNFGVEAPWALLN